MNSEITYTFSRALHLMRYGSEKMRPILWESDCFVTVHCGNIYRQCTGYKEFYSANNLEIMGSWVEVN